MGRRGCLIWSTEAAALHRGLGGAVRLALGGTPPPACWRARRHYVSSALENKSRDISENG